MCYHKSLVTTFDQLASEYAASFSSIQDELDEYKVSYEDLMARDESKLPYSKTEMAEMRAAQKTIDSFQDGKYVRYHENGFDFLGSPVITTGDPEHFTLMRWGFVPFFLTSKEEAFAFRLKTLNCISEEMYDKRSFKEAAKNGQRCLIPVTGFYEWRWVDPEGKKKIPYYISTRNAPVSSLAGLYSRWKDKATDSYYYSYTILTTKANPFMEAIHNSKKRMPVIIPDAYKKDWLNPNLTKDDVLALCQPLENGLMQGHTISNTITKRGVDTNILDVLKVHNYEKVNTDDLRLF
jgi:putative SOS response-associated peptidase YedK